MKPNQARRSAPKQGTKQKRGKQKPRSVAVLGQRGLPEADRRMCLRALRRVVRAANLGSSEVGVVFVNDLEMRALNRAWRKKDAPTDVLSFSSQEGEPMPGTEDVLGDLVISVDTARRQARALGHALESEIAVLVAHGLCHLGGLDHERGAEEARAQEHCEHTLLAIAGYDPAAALLWRATLS